MIKKNAFIFSCAVFVNVLCAPGCNRANPPVALSSDSDAPNRTHAPVASLSAKEILGNPDCVAFCYGGYRGKSRDLQPTVAELKEDVRILAAMGVKVLRTYNTQQYEHSANLLRAIHELKQDDAELEMYVMLGAWIACEDSWTDDRNHEAGDTENNTDEIGAAVELANQYPDIVKVIAVGNEAMVHWATQYFVRPAVILKWVNHLQGLKSTGKLPGGIWVTSSDNYASWGGGSADYRTDDLAALIKAVDYVSLHTYPFHETHYEPQFWGVPDSESQLSDLARADAAVNRAAARAKSQYQSTAEYIKSLGIDKPIHIGETGWASVSGGAYGANGSQAADEYKARQYYEAVRKWTNRERISCFYFEAFDERWKDLGSAAGSENHFGLIDLKGQAKYVLWEQVDAGEFKGLTRGGVPISKTFGGDESALKSSLLQIPLLSEMPRLEILTVNKSRRAGQEVAEERYVVKHDSLAPDATNDATYPCAKLKLITWEGTCGMEMSQDGVIHVATSKNAEGWWGCGLELQSSGDGENLSQFRDGTLTFDVKGDTSSTFNVGFQTGVFAAGDQVNNFVTFGPGKKLSLAEAWTTHTVSISDMDKGAKLNNVTTVFYFHGENGGDGKAIDIRNIYYSKSK